MPANLQISPVMRNVLLLCGISLLSACITINIYFPSAAAEKAADKVIDEVWQLQDQATKPATTPGQPPADPVPSAEPAK